MWPYRQGHARGRDNFSIKGFWLYQSGALWGALWCYLLPMWALPSISGSMENSGHSDDAGLWAVGGVSFTMVVLVSTGRLMLDLTSWHWVDLVCPVCS